MMKAKDVANFFIYLSKQADESFMTNAKLNKLLFYAQGCHLERTGKPLFNEPIEAWTYGPVVPEIYHKYKEYGKTPIETIDKDFIPSSITGDELETLLDVAREYGKYTVPYLINLTHVVDTPWSTAWNSEKKQITLDEMKAYFRKHPVTKFLDNLETITVCPKEWYDESEDKEWEAYLD